MVSFLDEVAAYLSQKYGSDISDIKVVFPSRRGGNFFTEALRKHYKQPIWQPDYLSIDDIMCETAQMEISDNIRLITELYRVYSKYHTETIDSFYFWGDALLSNFDIVDKYRIDADMLFKNISDLKDLENDYSYLSENQLEIIKTFWKNFDFDDKPSDEKQKFLTIWNSLLPIYNEFRQSLRMQSLAYTGMIHREATDKIKSGYAKKLLTVKYAFIGFNALSDSEKALFKYLYENTAAEFFWDYDNYYVENRSQEAGLFIRDNLKSFGNKDFIPSHNSFSTPKSIRVIAAPSDSMQCKYVHNLLSELIAQGKTPGKETAIVLTNENLLLPALYSIPEEVKNINITMGYPLRQTPAYTFVERLLELQMRKRDKKFYHRDVIGILSHPFVASLGGRKITEMLAEIRKNQDIFIKQETLLSCNEPLLNSIFECVDGIDKYLKYLVNTLTIIGKYAVIEQNTAIEREIIGTIIEHIYKVNNSLNDCSIEVSEAVLVSLLRRVLQSATIPFVGEPTSGIQVMGILETRSLDFENVLILSMNDDTFPGTPSDTASFIPANLRIAYGIPTPQHHEGVYAYYFYRLMQRAKNIDLVYAAKSDDKQTGEPSRYIYQLDYESPHNVVFKSILLNVNLSENSSIQIEKSDKILAILNEFIDGKGERMLTPSSFYNYVECPMKFYFNNVAGLKELEEISDGVDSAVFGKIVHKAIELLYRPLLNHTDAPTLIKTLINTPEVEQAVIEATKTEYIKDRLQDEELSGQIAIIKDIAVRYINKNLMYYDSTLSDFSIVDVEKRIHGTIDIDGIGRVQLGGTIDRVDSLPTGQLRVVDYKTGSCNNSIKSIEGLFSNEIKFQNRAAFQVLFYSYVLGNGTDRDVIPTLYAMMRMNSEEFSTNLQIEKNCELLSLAPYKGEFSDNIKRIISELFSPTVAFTQTETVKTCEYCSFREICGR